MLTKKPPGSIDADPVEWVRLQEDVIAFPRLRKKKGGLAQKSGMLTGIRMQSFELFRLYGGIYSPALQLKSPHKSLIHEKPQNSAIAASPRRIVALSIWRCATVRVRARTDRCDIVLSSRLTVGNFIFPFIQMAEARESSYIRLDPWTQTAGKLARSTVTPAVSFRAIISDFGGIDDNWDTVNTAPSLVHSSHVRFSSSDGRE